MSRRLGCLVAPLLLVLPLVIPWQFWLREAGEYLVNDSEPIHADLVVVLAGDFSGNRILKAAELVRMGYAPKALISGPAGMYGEYESDAAIRFAVRHGYPAEWFVPFPNQTHSTVEEAQAVAAKLREWKVSRVDIVTSNYHTRRATVDYRRAAQGIEFRMIGSPDLYFTPDGWWRAREARKTFLNEWLKTVATWFGI